MIGLTDYITERPWTDIFTVWYVLIDDMYQHLIEQVGCLRQRGSQPTFTDSEVITAALIIETFFHGHEDLGLAFLRQYHLDLFPDLLDKTRFNRRRRELTGVMEVMRRQQASYLIDPDDRVRLLDSAPIATSTYTRGGSCTTVTGPEYVGYVPSKKAPVFGFRLHLSTSLEQVVDQWMIVPASNKDATVTTEFFHEAHDLWVLADNAFHDPRHKDWLAKQRDITLVTAQRKDAVDKWPKASRRLFNQLRRRIETAFSVLTIVFNIERPGSHSLSGLLSRLTTRLLAYNLSFLTNVELYAL